MEDIIKKKLILEFDWRDDTKITKKEFKDFKEISINFDNWGDDDYLDESFIYKILSNHHINRNKIKVFIVKEDL